MQKVIFSTAIGTSVTIDDVNTSKDSNGYVPLHLLSFDGNSEGYTHDTSERVGFDGAGFYGAKANAKAIEIDIALLPRDGRESTMYDLRRAMLREFEKNGGEELEKEIKDYIGSINSSRAELEGRAK